ncbi:single-stranded-DNA-specific exonuclease [Rhizomicrobium palustre]|uniref:Single-stranded-DNA-specific exonuclease RecJ n=1 Tax=Rhizomicrobium palustre TaxID=189966 RepID=A0A846N4D5_9PROT|nr:single-stranded-DNA-specific exonuclease RecJ [Rhizomicrobium palustre]NIK89910.1 single-stranded-DNA-specific exonuclease [Rhizomicrobium palustre]
MQIESSFSGRKWQSVACDEEQARALVHAHQLPAVMARFLVSRGVAIEEAQDYLHPTLKKLLPDPFVLKDMETAVTRVVAAIEAGEKIAVFGDYDVDGSCSAALFSDFLEQVYEKPRLYVPDRMTEGYGPNAAALLGLQAEGISLVVTVDCGAGAIDALTKAHEAGLDVVILDHHAAENLPPAVAHVNPNAGGDASGLTYVCAAGITFLFLVALNRALRQKGWYVSRSEPKLLDAIDLVGLATVCDVVPLLGVNRAFVRAGLAKLGSLERPGVAALAKIGGATAPFTPYHLGFVFGPRINAGGRVGRCGLGVDLLTARDPASAEDFAQALDTHNRERQALEKLILDEAITMAASESEQPFILVSGEGWHPGVVGIVAGRLKDRFKKPAFVAGFDGVASEGGLLGRGSARSVTGVNVGAMIRAAREAGVIETGGGHAMAAGFGLYPEQVEPFRDFLLEAFEEGGVPEPEPLQIDLVIAPAGATEGLVRDLALAGPYGASNPEPMLVVAEAMVSYADIVGQGHVRLRLSGSDGARLDAIAFRAADTPLGQALLKARGTKIHAAGRLKTDSWNGAVRVQLQLEDASPAGV